MTGFAYPSELAQGMAPGAKNKPKKVLRNIVSEPPPTLEKHSGNYSKSMREFVALCLQKTPLERYVG
jgi:hypothetical protein